VQAIILSAGVGRRLWPLTRDRPKSMIDVGGGRSILERQLDHLTRSRHVDQVTVVAGHKVEVIEEGVAPFENVEVRYNPYFESHGPLSSLFEVRDLISRADCIVMNGDTLFGAIVMRELEELGAQAPGLRLLVSPSDEVLDDEVSVLVEDGRVCRVGKELEERNARSAGIFALFGSAVRRQALDQLEVLARSREFHDPGCPWHKWVEVCVERGPAVIAHCVPDDAWTEIDLHVDVRGLVQALAARAVDDLGELPRGVRDTGRES
jgi:L-glutamine-phosphate cytidylyltransferase